MKRTVVVIASLLFFVSFLHGCGPAETKGADRLVGPPRPAASTTGPWSIIQMSDRQYNVIRPSAPKPDLAGCYRWLFVDASASPEGDGSKLRPFRTIQAALDAAGPGTAIFIAGGVYDSPLRITKSGLPGKPIVLTAAYDEQVVVAMSRLGEGNLLPSNIVLEDASHIEISGLIIDGLINPDQETYSCSGIAVYGGRDCRFTGNVICRQSTSGISISASGAGGEMLCEGNVIFDIGGEESPAGIFVTREDCVVRGNVVFNVAGSGIEIQRSAMHAKVLRNVCFHCDGAGIRLSTGADGWAPSVPPRVVANNTCWSNEYGLVIHNRSLGNEIRGNIFSGDTLAEIATSYCSLPPNTSLEGNCVYPAQGAIALATMTGPAKAADYAAAFPQGPAMVDAKAISADPRLADPAGGDFRLRFDSPLAKSATVGAFGIRDPRNTSTAPANPSGVERTCASPLKEFQSCSIAPAGWGNYMFPPGEFPKIRWQEPERIRKLIGNVPLKVRWFDNDLNEVAKADKPGRYAAVVEGTTGSGLVVRRAMTFYCRPAEWQPWPNAPKAFVDYMPGSLIDRQAWDQRKEEIAGWSGLTFLNFLETKPEGASLMSYLAAMKPLEGKPTRVDTPDVYDMDFHLALKRKLSGADKKYPALKPPWHVSGTPAPVLREGTAAEAGMKGDATERLRAICREWYEQSNEPFVVLVARHGVIVIHEPFGSGAAGPVTRDTQFGLASLTKLLTGTMFGQFMDQGLIGLDDPVGKHLDCFPNKEGMFTLRQCLTHTTGLTGHEEFGGMSNPYLENVLAAGVPALHPGRYHDYNGMGFDLAGKTMEVVSGKSIFRLMQENYFGPLGANGIVMHDLACDTVARAEDLARIGQMLLNKGRYGDLEFFSAQTFEKMRPQPLRKVLPNFGQDCVLGTGLQMLIEAHPQAGKGNVPKDKIVLGANVFGHGAASNTILRVDPDNDLVIVVARNRAGSKFNDYRPRFLMTIEECLVK